MWRSEKGLGAPSGCSSASSKATLEIPVQQISAGTFQHPVSNPTPFSTFPAAWVIGGTTLADGPILPSRSSANPTSSIVHAPSDLIPNGLLATPQPSTPATQLLKVIVNHRLTIPSQDTGCGSANGQAADSPENSSGPAIRPLDSLVLPSPSLLPGGVHSLPTPTSTSSQPLKPIDGYGSRGSPIETVSSKDSIPGPSAEPSGSAKSPIQSTRPGSAASNRRTETSLPQNLSRSGSIAGSSGSGLPAQGRGVDGSSSSNGASAAQKLVRNPQPPVAGGHHSGYGGAAFQHNHVMPPPPGAGYQVPQHPPAPPAAAAGCVQPPPGSPTMGYSTQPYYMPQVPPGAMVVGLHHTGSSSAGSSSTGGALNSRASVSGNAMSGTSREGSGGSGWRGGSRSAGGSRALSGGPAAAGGGGGGQGHKHANPYNTAQQVMPGHMVHDGCMGPYGMAHMPYAVYGMMAPGLVVPQVMPPVVGSPRSMEAHGSLAHQPVHMGPMMIPHGPSMAMGMGLGHPMHSFPAHGHMGGPHMGMHPHSHPQPHPHMSAAHPHSAFSHPHGPHYHGGGGPASVVGGGGGYGHAQQPYGLGMHALGGLYGGVRGAGTGAKGAGAGVGTGGSQLSGKASRSGAPAAGAAAAAPGGEAGSGGAAAGAAGSTRDSPVMARGRSGGREKAEGKGRSAEQRERKPGNSRAPTIVAQCAAEMPSLEQQLQDLVRQLTPGEDELVACQVALAAVKELVGGRWPDVKVHLFGSAANGLSIAGSNEIDVTIEVPDIAWDDHAAKAAMVSELGELAAGVATAAPAAAAVAAAPGGPRSLSEGGAAAAAAAADMAAGRPAPARDGDAVGAIGSRAAAGPGPAAGPPAAEAEAEALEADEGLEAARPLQGVMSAVSALPKARTPIVKMTVASTQTRVDITINNLLALSNTRMLGHYFQIDPRVRQLALLVKHWARTRSVNDAYRGSLSSYAYVLLCIWLLQQRQPAILPVLQQRQPHTYDTTVGPWRCSYNDRFGEVKDFGAANKETLAELLVAFFDHWAWRHDYNGAVVCVRTGGTVPKASKEWTKRQGNERHLMCIEDPFELSHDLGRTIDKAAVQVLRREFERAARIFASNPDPLQELLAPLTQEEEAAVAAALQSRRKASKDKERAKEKVAAAAAAAAATGSGGEGGGDGGDSGADPSAAAAPTTEDSGAAGRSSRDLDSEGEDWPGNVQLNGFNRTSADVAAGAKIAIAGSADAA